MIWVTIDVRVSTYPQNDVIGRDLPLDCAVGSGFSDQRRCAGARTPRHSQQYPSRHEQIGQTTTREQPVRVLTQTPVANLGKSEHALDRQKRMLDFRSRPRPGPVLRPVLIGQGPGTAAFPVGKIPGTRGTLEARVA